MAQIKRPDTAFSLSHGLKRPKQAAPDHLRFVHGLSCLICGAPGEAAHVRYGSLAHGKRETGAGQKPDDKWTVPLCPAHHREGPDAQHNHSERKWWVLQGIDPLVIAALLWACTGDNEAAEQVCMHARWLKRSG